MAAATVLFLVTFLGGLAAFAAWDLISKRGESQVWTYCAAVGKAFNSVSRAVASAVLFTIGGLKQAVTAPWRLTQKAMNDPVNRLVGELEQRLDSLETIQPARSPKPEPDTATNDARREEER